jgi:2-polyprenyl-3-methyl-5-hydroxy-6-metoxy-1,4-benzoquinol methylase
VTSLPAPAYDPLQSPRGERRALLDRISPGQTILDVGCWSGFAGEYLIERSGAIVDGIEPDPDMARLAGTRYRTVLPMPAERGLPTLAARGRTYDAILFMDVLEHLDRPDLALRSAVSLLEPGGRVFASIPNVAHWSVRKGLLLGHWDYHESGLMDRTHLRFYTVRTAQSLLEDVGLRVVWRSFSLGQPPVVRLAESRLRMLRRWPELFAVQILFAAAAS